jgi:hypothetical protein
MRLGGGILALALAAVLGCAIAIAAAVVAPRTGASVPAVTKTVLLVGDSVPKSLADELGDAAAQRGYAVVSAATGGCPATGVGKVSSSGVRFKKNTCPTVVAKQDQLVELHRPALVIWWSRYEVAPRLATNGTVLPLGSPAYWRVQQASFAKRTRALTRRGARLVAVQIERPGRALAVRNPTERSFLIGRTLLRRDILNAWNAFLARHSGPTLYSISIDWLVCHDGKNACDDTLPDGEPARPDGVHYSDTAQRLLAPQIFEGAWRVARLDAAPTS